MDIVDFPPTKVKQRVMGVDLAFTKPSEVVKSPDSTAFVLMSKDMNGMYNNEYVHTMQDKVHAVENKIFDLARHFGPDVIWSIPQDPNAAAGAYARDLQLGWQSSVLLAKTTTSG